MTAESSDAGTFESSHTPLSGAHPLYTYIYDYIDNYKYYINIYIYIYIYIYIWIILATRFGPSCDVASIVFVRGGLSMLISVVHLCGSPAHDRASSFVAVVGCLCARPTLDSKAFERRALPAAKPFRGTSAKAYRER